MAADKIKNTTLKIASYRELDHHKISSYFCRLPITNDDEMTDEHQGV